MSSLCCRIHGWSSCLCVQSRCSWSGGCCIGMSGWHLCLCHFARRFQTVLVRHWVHHCHIFQFGHWYHLQWWFRIHEECHSRKCIIVDCWILRSLCSRGDDRGYYHFPGILPVEFAIVIQLGQVEFDTDESSIKIIPIDDDRFLTACIATPALLCPFFATLWWKMV